MSTEENAVLQSMVVGVDGSEGSRGAVEWAAQLAGLTGGEVVAVHVLTYDHELLEDLTPDTMRDWRAEVTSRVRKEWTAPLAGVTHRSLVVEAGSAAKGLLDAAAEADADLLVVGSHGRSGFVGRVLGGVAHRVTHQATVPVVVVPPEWSAS